jgi:hypothetical protein
MKKPAGKNSGLSERNKKTTFRKDKVKTKF